MIEAIDATHQLLEQEARRCLGGRVAESQITAVIDELKAIVNAAFDEGATPEEAWNRCIAAVFEARRRQIN